MDVIALRRRHLRAGSTLLPLLLLASGSAWGDQPLFAVNCGSDRPVRHPDGTVYHADQEYSGLNDHGAVGGRAYVPAVDPLSFYLSDVDGDSKIHSTQRIGVEKYVFELGPGTYELSLHMAEFARNAEGFFSLDLSAEGQTIRAGFDPLVEVGECRAYDIRVLVDVQDGAMDVVFEDESDFHTVSAISVREMTPPVLPVAPTGVAVYDTYDGALIRWDDDTTNTLAGYRVLEEKSCSGWDEGPHSSAWSVAHNWRFVPFSIVPLSCPKRLGVIAFDIYGNFSDTTFTEAVGPRPIDAVPFETYELWIEQDDLDHLNTHVFSDTVSVPADFLAFNTLHSDVSVSYRGSAQRSAPKKSWNINLEDTPRILGADRLALKATFIDKTFQRELLMADLLHHEGLPHSITFPVRLALNGEHVGNLLHVERLNDDFLDRMDWNPDGRFYRVNSAFALTEDIKDYRKWYESATTEDWAREDIVEFVENLNHLADKDILPWLEKNVDLDEYIALACHQSIVGSQDWIRDDYYIYRDAPDAPWVVVPWDLHETFDSARQPIGFGTKKFPIWSGEYSRLLDRVLGVPSLRRRYGEKMNDLLTTHMSADSILATAQLRADVLQDEMVRDVRKFSREYEDVYFRGLVAMTNAIVERDSFLLAAMEEFEEPEYVLVRIAELIPNADGDVARVEVLNLASRSFELENFFLTDDREAIFKWSISPRTIPGHGRTVLTVASPIAPGGWVGLTQNDEDQGVADSLVIPDIGVAQSSYGRYPDQSGRWQIMDRPTPGAENVFTSPVLIALELSDYEPSIGDIVEMTSTIRNLKSWTIVGELRLELHSWAGIRPDYNPIIVHEIEIRGGEHESILDAARIPGRKLDVGGYRAVARFLDGNGAELISTSHELFVHGEVRESVVINEIMAVNDTTIADEAGEYDDWVELANPSDIQISTEGYFLTDDLDNEPFKWAFPAAILRPGQKHLVWCDNSAEQGDRHANFKLSGNGEEVALTREGDERDVEVVDRWVFGAQTEDVAIGRYPDGGITWLVPDRATPGETNVYTPE